MQVLHRGFESQDERGN